MLGRRKGPILFSLLMTVVFAVAIVLALGYSYRARLAPLVLAVPGFALAAGRLVIELRLDSAERRKEEFGASPDEKQVVLEGAGPSPAQGGGAAAQAAVAGNGLAKTFSEVNVFLWLALLMAMLYLLGFLVTIPLYLLLYLKVRSREGWPLSVIVSLVSWATLYFLFVRVLGMNLYTGVIAELLL